MTPSPDSLTEGLVLIVVLAFLIERALAIVFDWSPFERRFGKSDLKTPIALAVSIAVAAALNFKLFGIVARECQSCGLSPGIPGWIDVVLTGAIIAGGSAAAVKLVQDVLGINKVLRDEKREVQHKQLEAEKAEASARLTTATLQRELAYTMPVASPGRLVARPVGGVLGTTDPALEARIMNRSHRLAVPPPRP